MAVLKRRSRLVTFRVSSDEYQELAACCLKTGARSIADFARAAVIQTVQATHVRPGTLSGDLTTLGKALTELDVSLTDMRKRIRSVLGSVSPEDLGWKEG